MNSSNIAIIDYGAGNISSIQNAFLELGLTNTKLTGDRKVIERADAIVLPGVGAFSHCASSLLFSGLTPIIRDLVFDKLTPILGICVGMQLFADSSTENGLHAGLGWIPGRVTRLNPPIDFTIPHVGWNQIKIVKRDGILKSIKDEANLFFDHSFSFECNPEFISGITFHGLPIIASIEHKNIFGVQFHPEKSGRNGLKILREFVNKI